MVDELTDVPARFYAGDSFAWTRDLSDYPASVWTLTYYFSKDDHSFTAVASAVGDLHSVEVAGAVTAAYKAGRYRWHARVTDGTDVFTVEDGWLEVYPDPTTSKLDWRSHARKMVDAIEATLEGQATKQQLDLISYSFGAVNVSRDRKFLLDARDKYARELTGEPGSTTANPRFIPIRFVAP